MKPNTVKFFGTPAFHVMSPANKILHDLKNTSASSFSIQSSLSRISVLNSSRTVNASKVTLASTIKNPANNINIVSLTRAIQLLEHSVDVMASRAEELFYNCEYKRCIKVIDEILEKDPYHKRTLFVQIGCLMELKDSNGNFVQNLCKIVIRTE